MKIETIGLDIAVQIFQAHGVDRSAGNGVDQRARVQRPQR